VSWSDALLEMVSLEVMVESIRPGTHLESGRDWVPDFRSCNAETVGGKWCWML